MSKKIKKDEPIAPDQALSKAEAFVTKHKKAFIIAILAIFAFVGFNAFNEDATEKKENTEAEAAIANIEAISFDGLWTGPAHDNLTSSLDSVLSKLKIEKSKVEAYAGLLDNLQTYKNNIILPAVNSGKKRVDTKSKEI